MQFFLHFETDYHGHNFLLGNEKRHVKMITLMIIRSQEQGFPGNACQLWKELRALQIKSVSVKWCLADHKVMII